MEGRGRRVGVGYTLGCGRSGARSPVDAMNRSPASDGAALSLTWRRSPLMRRRPFAERGHLVTAVIHGYLVTARGYLVTARGYLVTGWASDNRGCLVTGEPRGHLVTPARGDIPRGYLVTP